MSLVFESSSLITLFVGENLRRGKVSSHLTKISSLFPDELSPDKVGHDINQSRRIHEELVSRFFVN